MAKKILYCITGLALISFIVFSTYLWYGYFLDLNSDGKLINTTGTGKIIIYDDNDGVYDANEKSKTDQDGLSNPVYKFRIINRKNKSGVYALYIVDIPLSEVNDKCTKETILERNQLKFQLKMNNNVIKTGKLSDLDKNMIDKRLINIDVTNFYELVIWIDEETTDWEGKHFHYRIEIEEVEK